MMHRRPAGAGLLVSSLVLPKIVLTPSDGLAREPREASLSFHDAVAEVWARLPARRE